MKTKKDKIKLLEETAAFYTLKNRCTTGYSCLFYKKGLPGCAIGRLIKDKELAKSLNGSSEGFDTGVVEVFDKLPIELQEYGKDFLVNLQSLHDTKDNWTETGLSEHGKHKVEDIKANIQQGVY